MLNREMIDNLAGQYKTDLLKMLVIIGLVCMLLKEMKEVFYLTTHSTHFIYGYMVRDHSDS